MKHILLLSAFMAAGLLGAAEKPQTVSIPFFDEWYSQSYTMEGKVEKIQPGCKSKTAFHLTPTLRRQRWRASMRKMLPRFYCWGSTAKLQVMVRGKGNIRLAFHFMYTNAAGRDCFQAVESPLMPVDTAEWKSYSWEHQIRVPGIFQFGTLLISEGEKSDIYADKFNFTLTSNNAICAENTLIEAVQGTRPAAKFTVNSTVKDAKAFDGIKFTPAKIQKGVCTVTFAQNAVQAGVCADHAGAAATVHYVTQADWNKRDSAAKQIKLKAPRKVLILGDSISDFDRGYNYADKWSFWVNRYNPGKFSIRNAGVAGDYIISMLRRWNNDKNIWDLFRYEGIDKEKYDYVVVFIGANDTRKTWNPKTKQYTPLVPIARMGKEYRKLLANIKARYNAKIILFTPMCLDMSRSMACCKKAIEKGTGHTIFGDPAFLDAYAAEVRKIAKENNAAVLELLKLSRAEKNRNEFFKGDGVHLTRKGNDFVAEQLLNFSKKQLD